MGKGRGEGRLRFSFAQTAAFSLHLYAAQAPPRRPNFKFANGG
jgi:hypothetical protein